jgi:predicted TIM-barrel fold metal-dependent hydrolase
VGWNTREVIVVKIDIHVHPQFVEPQQGNAPPQLHTKKLDIVANPQDFPIALSQTSQYYYQRNHVMLPLPEFINQMNQAGIDKVVLVNPAIKGIPVRPMNEGVAKLLKAYPDKFIGFAGFDPNTGAQAVDEIEYAVKELGFSGIKTVSSTLELDINDKAFYPCYSKAQELGIPILTHVGSVLIKGVRVKHVHPLMVDDVAFDFPDLKIICAHLGSWQYLDTISMLLHHQNVFADLSFWPLHPLYAGLVPWSLLERTVSDKILLGSDYPAGQTPREAVEAVKKLPVSQNFKEKILGNNAARILGL